MGGERCMKAGILMIELFEQKENIEQKVRIEQKKYSTLIKTQSKISKK